MKRVTVGWLVAAMMVLFAAVLTTPGFAQNLVVNGDFETDTELFVTWPGYVGSGANPTTISGWTTVGGAGINPVVPGAPTDAPFRDNGDNTTSVAFLQGISSIEQTVTGLIVGQPYQLTMDFNARNCCGDPVPTPVAEILVDGKIVANSEGLFPGGGVPAVGGNNPWYSFEPGDLAFLASAESLTLKVQTRPLVEGTDTTLLVDNVAITLVPEPSTALLGLIGLLGLARCRPRKP